MGKKAGNRLQERSPGTPVRSSRPLTVGEKMAVEVLMARWRREGRNGMEHPGRRNLAIACVRSVTARVAKYGLDAAWSLGMWRARLAKWAKAGYARMSPEAKAREVAGRRKGLHMMQEQRRMRKLAGQEPDGRLRLRKRIPGNTI